MLGAWCTALGALLACRGAPTQGDAPRAAPSATSRLAQSSATAGPAPSPSASSRRAEEAPHPVAIAASIGHTVALLSTGEVLAWGANVSGVLGLPKPGDVTAPTPVPGVPPLRQISTGRLHTCGVTLDGHAMCWGRNLGGALGNGSAREEAHVPPGRVVGLDAVTEVRAGGNHTCALLADHAAQCWGFTWGDPVARPERVKEPAFVALAVGGDASCGVLEGGALTCWGLRIGKAFEYGEAIEGGDANIRREPVRVAKIAGVKQVSLSFTHACAVAGDGDLFCWGYGDKGALGTGKSGESYVLLAPTRVAGLGKVAEVSAGEGFTCALLADATVSCWGDNEWGQLGVGDRKRRAVPTSVPGLTTVRAVAVGGAHACALFTDGRIACWGKNLSGEVGDGTSGFKATRTSPTPVSAR
jgi:alpha-tubulin suppressor-like RCC1 family protein